MTQDEFYSTVRSGSIFIAGAAAWAGLIAVTTATGIESDVQHMINGAKEFMLGAGPLIALALAWWGKNKASLSAQVATVQAAQPAALVAAVQEIHPVTLINAVADIPAVQSIVATQAIADATPSDKVVGPPKATGTK